MNELGLALRQVRYENLAFWRNPPAAFFTFVFPLMFLIIFNFVFGNEEVSVEGGATHMSTVLIPSIAAFSIITAQYTNVAMGITFARDQGLLKRIRGTPLRPWAFIFGRVAHATLIGLLLVAITVVTGTLFYRVDVPTTTMAAFLTTVFVGAASFSAMGVAVTSVIPSADAAPAIVNFSILPLLFVSDVFIRIDDPPAWLDALRNVLPVIHLQRALEAAFSPFASGNGFEPGHLAVLAAWGIAATALAVRFFSWEPRV